MRNLDIIIPLAGKTKRRKIDAILKETDCKIIDATPAGGDWISISVDVPKGMVQEVINQVKQVLASVQFESFG